MIKCPYDSGATMAGYYRKTTNSLLQNDGFWLRRIVQGDQEWNQIVFSASLDFVLFLLLFLDRNMNTRDYIHNILEPLLYHIFGK